MLRLSHSTVSLISHASEILQRARTIILTTRTEIYPGKDQFGLGSGYGTREAICTMRTLGKGVLDNDLEMYVCFIDFEKAFDRVQ